MGGSIKVKCAAFDLSDFLSPLIYSSLLSSPSMHCQAAFPSRSLPPSSSSSPSQSILPLAPLPPPTSYLIHVISHLFAWYRCQALGSTNWNLNEFIRVALQCSQLICICLAAGDCVFFVIVFLSSSQAFKPVVGKNLLSPVTAVEFLLDRQLEFLSDHSACQPYQVMFHFPLSDADGHKGRHMYVCNTWDSRASLAAAATPTLVCCLVSQTELKHDKCCRCWLHLCYWGWMAA